MGRYEEEAKTKTVKNGKKTARRKALLVVLLLTIAAGCYAAYDIFSPPEQVVPPPRVDPDKTTPDPVTTDDPPPGKTRKKNFYTFLIVGTNDDYNTDVIMLGAVDTDKDTVNVVSIPRDTMVDRDIKIRKINGAYGRSGMEELLLEVEEVTGVFPDYYCLVNMENFVSIVDVIGGVQFDVPYKMYHEDADERFNINLKAGLQDIDGKKAIQLVRYRGTSGSDYDRMKVQRDFLVAVCKKMVNSFTISQATDIIGTVNKSIKTNMPVKDMVWFYTNVVRTINFDTGITFGVMPDTTTGKYKGQDYVYLNAQSTCDYINTHINPYNTPITVDELKIKNLKD